MPRKKKPAYDATIRFRAFSNLERRIERIVKARGYGDAADFLREGTTERVMEEEVRLGLPPLMSDPSVVDAPKVSDAVRKARKKKRQAASPKADAA